MEEHKSHGIKSTGAIHKSYAASCKQPRKQRSVARKNQVKVHHQRSPYALKFEDRSQDETGRQEQCARGNAWILAKNILKLKDKDKATFSSLTNEWCLPALSVTKPEAREFVVNSAASERSELCRIGNRKGLSQSDDSCCSKRRSANKRRSDSVCQRI